MATPVKSIKRTKLSDAEMVAEYMNILVHPLKETIEMLRTTIMNAATGIHERIKWNAPSYYYQNEDMVTFNPRDKKRVHLIFHHSCIEQIPSSILEGNFKSRRMCFVNNMADAQAKAAEIQRIIREITGNINTITS